MFIEMNISPLDFKDCKEAAELHKKAFLKGWDTSIFEEFLESSLVFGVKIKKDQILSGYILWRQIQDEAEILTFAVAPPFQRKGVGSALITHLCAILKEAGIIRLFLEVAEDNREALSFYLKHDFIFLSKRPHYYPRDVNRYISALNFVKNLI